MCVVCYNLSLEPFVYPFPYQFLFPSCSNVYCAVYECIPIFFTITAFALFCSLCH